MIREVQDLLAELARPTSAMASLALRIMDRSASAGEQRDYAVTEDFEDDELRQLERGLQKLVEAEGFYLTETCHDYQPGYYGTLHR